MKLDNLRHLYYEMLKEKSTRQEFDFEYNGVNADVFFFIDKKPFILAFGIKLTQAYFELEVKPGFEVETLFSHKIYDLITKEFHINYDPNHKYSPFDFLRYVNDKIPHHIKETRAAEPRLIAHYHRDIEEADKIYFCGFINHRAEGRHVSSENLRKTRLLMGEDAYQRCLAENISTKWTNEIGKDRFEHWKNIKPEDYFLDY